MQAAEALARNIKREHTLRTLVDCVVYHGTLTAAQLARAAVFSYPLLPDVRARAGWPARRLFRRAACAMPPRAAAGAHAAAPAPPHRWPR